MVLGAAPSSSMKNDDPLRIVVHRASFPAPRKLKFIEQMKRGKRYFASDEE
jgi:hypothetical protein